MAAILRLLVLSLLLSLTHPASSNEKISKDDLDAQKELLQLKIDSGRELVQKDLDSLKTRIDLLDRRIDDQNNRVGDIGQAVDRLGVIVALVGLLVTLLLAFLGLIGYISVARRVAEEAKLASQKWFDDNQHEVAIHIRKLEKAAEEAHLAAEQAHQKIDNSVNDAEQYINAAINHIQKELNTPNEQAQPISPIEQQALHQTAEQIRGKPEATYSFEDWNKRAFDAYHSGQYEDAALYWKRASGITSAKATSTAQALFNRALTLNQLKRSDDACAVYGQLIATYGPDNTPAIRELVAKTMLNMGVILKQTQRLAETISTYEQLIATYSSDNAPAIRELVAKAMFNKGIVLRQMREPAAAIATYKQLIATYSPDSTPAIRELVAKTMLNMGMTFDTMQEAGEEIATYEQLIATYSPGNTPSLREVIGKALFNKAVALRKIQGPAEAIATYNHLIATYSSDNTPATRELVANAFNGKGFVHLIEAKKAWDSGGALALLREAEAELRASLDLRADCGMTLGNLAYVQWLLGDQQAAEERFRAALAAPKNSGETLYLGTLADIALHRIQEDDAFQGMVERLWTESLAAETFGELTTPTAQPAQALPALTPHE